MLVYVDNILCIHEDPNSVHFPLTPNSVGTPDIYQGAKLKLMKLENGVWSWRISLSKYVREAVKNCKDYVTKHLPPQYRLPKLVPNPFPVLILGKMDGLPSGTKLPWQQQTAKRYVLCLLIQPSKRTSDQQRR